MAVTSTSSRFQSSYENFAKYPSNLIYKTIYTQTLNNYRERLNAAAEKLCSNEKGLHVRFRDSEDGTLETVNIRTVEELEARLFGNESKGPPYCVENKDPVTGEDSCVKSKGMQPKKDPVESQGSTIEVDSKSNGIVTKKDPKCRFIFLWAAHSRDRLKVTKEALFRVFSFHQVHPSYLDFLLMFGKQTEPKEFRMSGFRAHCFLDEIRDTGDAENTEPATEVLQANPRVPELGRSGRCFQLSWNLKTVVKKLGPAEWPSPDDFRHWSIRQAAFYHQFDIETGCSLWICTSGREDIQERIDDLTGPNARSEDVRHDSSTACFRSSLNVMLDFCHWSAEGWRAYLRWSEESMEAKTELIVLGTRDDATNRVNYTSTDLQDVQIWEDVAQDIATVLLANVEILGSLQKFYLEMRDNNEFSLKDSCGKYITVFAAQVGNLIVDMRLQVARARSMVDVASSRKNLVVQHLQSQAAEEMGHLARESQKEAIAMRVIAAVTVLYLPATFVSTLFSTDVVKYQSSSEGQDEETSISKTAMMRWLQISLPLTVLTLLAAGFWYLRASRRLVTWKAAIRWIRRSKNTRNDGEF